MVSELIWSIYCSSQDLAGYYLHERIEKKVSPSAAAMGIKAIKSPAYD